MNPQDLQLLVECIDNRDSYQTTMGKVAYPLYKNGGPSALREVIDQVEAQTGKRIAYQTLKSYAWVYGKTHTLNLPEDITWKARQNIAGTKDPQKWANMIKDEGLSSAEVSFLILKERGIDPEDKSKIIKCPNCGYDWEE